MNRTRRSLLAVLGFASAGASCRALSSATQRLAQADEIKERASRASKENELAVEELYSTKPRRVVLGVREYRIPANFFGPTGKNSSDTFVAKEYFGFFLFMPDFGGYTKDNWRDPFDEQRIEVVQVKEVDKNAIVKFSDGTTGRVPPASYGDPAAQLENLRRRFEPSPSLKLPGLEGYRRKGNSTGVLWTGHRSNGEFFFFQATLAPDEPPRPGLSFPLCEARYYSEKEDLYVSYRYPQKHIGKWRKIDDAIWSKLHEWRVK